MCLIIGLAFLPIRLAFKGVDKGAEIVDKGVEMIQDKRRQKKLLKEAIEGVKLSSEEGIIQPKAPNNAIMGQHNKEEAPPSYCEVMAIRA